MHGEHNDGDVRVECLEILDQFNARGVFERNIHDGDVGLLREDLCSGLGPALRLAAHLETRLLIDKVG